MTGKGAEVRAAAPAYVYEILSKDSTDPSEDKQVRTINYCGEHDRWWLYEYAHLNSVAVEVGQNVETGQVIGIEGNTGYVFSAGRPVTRNERQNGSTAGTHLHFEVTQLERFTAAEGYAWWLKYQNEEMYVHPDGSFFKCIAYTDPLPLLEAVKQQQISLIKQLIALLTALLPFALKKSKLDAWADAIEEWEVYKAPGEDARWPNGTVAWRNKNPGNIKFAGQTYAIGKDEQGHAIFASKEHGRQALINQLKLAAGGRSSVYSPDMTLVQFFQKYAEANSIAYANFVAKATGVSPETQIKTLL